MNAPTESREHPIVLFDGICGLCDGFVTWLLRRDRRALFRVAPLQGETAVRLISRPITESEAQWSILLVEDGVLYERSEAVLKIVSRLGGACRFAGVLRVFPLGLRDRVYRFVAQNRYKWFGKRATCRVPTREEQDRFLP